MQFSTETLAKVKELRAGFTKRRAEYYTAVRDFLKPMLNEDATWNIPLTKEFGRLDLQIVIALWHGNKEDIVLANRLTRRSPVEGCETHRFGIFDSNIACHHLFVFGDLMEPETVEWCRQVITEGNSFYPGNMAPDYQFHGYNDNMPAMSVRTLILSGEMFDRQDWLEMGTWKLHRFAEQLSRCGLISEYNSPNYCPDTIHNLATLAHYTKNDEIREMTKKILERIWLDLAAHWCPEGHNQAGPFSRGYIHDYNNYLSPLNCLLWFLFGPEVSRVSAMETMYPRDGIELIHGNDPLEHTARMVWYALTDDSSLSDETAALFIEKPDPFEIIASAEHGNYAEGPMKKATATSYISRDYSLGSASFGFLDAKQTTSIYASGRSKTNEISPILATKYLVNDNEPGQVEVNDFHHATTGEANLFSYGTAVTVQSKNSALISYVPYRDLADTDITYLRLVLQAPVAVGQFDNFVDINGNELKVGETYPVDAWYGATLGEALVAFKPLAYNAIKLPESKIVLRANKRYKYLEIINYQGEARKFTRKELSCILNGMAFEIASGKDWNNSPAEFIQAVAESAVFEDQYLFSTRRMRYYRNALKDREKLQLTIAYTTDSDGCAIRMVNGRNAPEPVWSCTDIPAETLPFLSPEEGFIAEPGLPWTDLSVYYIPDAPWAINHSGK